MKYPVGAKVEIMIEGVWSGKLGVFFLYARSVKGGKHRVKYQGASRYETALNVRYARTYDQLTK